ncbi:MAG: multidrug effflux MFS transporter [Gammaproteobacteria bacterium]|nr:multidrug effflux MFS transporter [Gammaproteobacteria bacterium]
MCAANAIASKKSLRWLPVCLAALVALTPFSIDSYLPALPDIAAALNSGVTQVQHSISSFLFGFAIGQLLGGPLSDRWGRRLVAFIGLMIYLFTTIAILFINHVEQLVTLRFFQAFGGGFATVIAAAIVRDLYSGREAAKILSIIGTMMLLAPLIAPAVGSALLTVAGWQSIFIFLLIYAFAMLLMVRWLLPETVPRFTHTRRQQSKPHSLFKNYQAILGNKRALGILFSQSCVAGSLFIYITTASVVFIEHFKVSSSQFPLLFCAGILGYIAMIQLNIRLLKFFEPRKILLSGICIQLLGCIFLLAAALIDDQSLMLWMVPLVLVIACAGITGPNGQACYLEFFPKISGSASAIYGATLFSAGGVLGAVANAMYADALAPLAGAMLGCASMALLVALVVAQIWRPIKPF